MWLELRISVVFKTKSRTIGAHQPNSRSGQKEPIEQERCSCHVAVHYCIFSLKYTSHNINIKSITLKLVVELG